MYLEVSMKIDWFFLTLLLQGYSIDAPSQLITFSFEICPKQSFLTFLWLFFLVLTRRYVFMLMPKVIICGYVNFLAALESSS